MWGFPTRNYQSLGRSLFGNLLLFQHDICILKFTDFKVIFEAAFETVEEVIVESPWIIIATIVQRDFQLNQQMEN